MLHSLLVKDYMQASLVTFKPEQDLMEAIGLLLENDITGAPVIDQLGNMSGMLSEKDCLRVAFNSSYFGDISGKVADYMSPQVVSVDLEASVLDVAKMFMSAPYKCYPVVTDNRLVGMINRHDVLRAIEHISQEQTQP